MVIEGAGPLGLLAAFQLFRSGMQIAVVNERAEVYLRRHLFYLDPKWIAELRFSLGMKFNDVFYGSKMLAVNFGRDRGQLNCKTLEDVRISKILFFIKIRFFNFHFFLTIIHQ